MANIVRYITTRDGVFYYSRRVPQSVKDSPLQFDALFGGKELYRRSLGTRRQSEALVKAQAVHQEFESRVSQAAGLPLISARADLSKRRVTPELLHKIRENYRSITAKPYRMAALRRESGLPADADEYDRLENDLELDAEEIRRVLIYGQEARLPKLDVATIADSTIASENLDAPKGSDARMAIQRVIRDGLLEGYTDASSMLSGKAGALPTTAYSRRSKAPLLSVVGAEYLARIKARRTKTEVAAALRDFTKLVGDVELDELSRDDFIRFCRHQGAKVIGGKNPGSTLRPMSAASLQKKMRLLCAMINHAKKVGVYDGPNPAEKIDVKAFTQPSSIVSMPDKRPFDIQELNRIFEYPWFTGCRSETRVHEPGDHRLSGMHYWVPIVALMTGCRAGELGGLMIKEVHLDHAFPHIEIRDNEFRSTKGAYSRKIPILDQLLELGFARFVATAQSNGGKRLFSDWKAPAGPRENDEPAWSNGAIIRSFNNSLVPNALHQSLAAGARREVTFHSFRGAFKTMLGMKKYALPVNYIHEVVGHEKFGLDKRYVGKIPLEETYPAIKGCKFERLTLPPPP